MAKKKEPKPGDGGSPYQPYKPKPSGPYVPAPKRLAKMKKRTNNNVNEV